MVWNSRWEMVQIDNDGLSFNKDFVKNTNSNHVKISSSFTLDPAYPNPFNGSIKIPFKTSLDADAEILIFSILGEEIYRKDYHNLNYKKDLYIGIL